MEMSVESVKRKKRKEEQMREIKKGITRSIH